MDWTPLLLTAKLAGITTILLVIISIPLAHWLAYSKNIFTPIIETLVSMPLVLPPTVLGFYLLLALGPSSTFGAWLSNFLGLKLIFSFPGLILASMLYSLPFMVQPIQAGFAKLSPSLKEASYVLGKSKWETLFKILLPNIRPAMLTGFVLAFAHTIGEFGVVLMIGGNIPGQTKVASIAIYDEVEAMNYGLANKYSLILLGFSFSVLLMLYLINGGYLKTFHHD